MPLSSTSSRGPSATSSPSITSRSTCATRRGLRFSRQQRRRQVDHHPHAVRPAEADQRHGDCRRRRRRQGSGRREAPHRLHVAALLAVRAADGRPEHPLLRRHLRLDRREARGAPAVRASTWPGLHGREQTQRAGSRRRLAAAAGARMRHPPRAADRVPGRADRRRRSAVAAPVLDADRSARRGRASPSWSRRTISTKPNTAIGIAIIHAGRLAAIGTTEELKRVFDGRADSRGPAAKPVDAMRLLDACRTSRRRASSARPCTRCCRRRGRVRHAAARLRRPACRSRRSMPVEPSLEDVFLEVVVERRGRSMRKALPSRRKEFRQIVRDRRTLMILLFVPAFFLLLYGYALNWDIRHVGLAVDDRDGRPRAARSSRRSSTPAISISVRDQSDERRQIDRLMDSQRRCAPCWSSRRASARPCRTGRPVAGPGAAERRQRQHGDDGDGLRADDLRSESARYSAVAGAVARRRWSRSSRASGTTRSCAARCSSCPGLIAYIAMITAVVSTALSIVREKERGTMEQVRMAPLDAASFVVGKTIPYFVDLAGVGVRRSSWSRWCCSGCRCAARGCCCCSRCRCSWSARSDSVCSFRASPTPSRSRFRSRCSCRSCRR